MAFALALALAEAGGGEQTATEESEEEVRGIRANKARDRSAHQVGGDQRYSPPPDHQHCHQRPFIPHSVEKSERDGGHAFQVDFPENVCAHENLRPAGRASVRAVTGSTNDNEKSVLARQRGSSERGGHRVGTLRAMSRICRRVSEASRSNAGPRAALQPARRCSRDSSSSATCQRVKVANA